MEVEWNDISVQGDHALLPTNLDRAVEDGVLVSFDLANRVDRSSLSTVCVLAEDGNNRSSVSDDLGGSVTYRQSLQLVIVDACNSNPASVASERTSIPSNDATVGSSVHQGCEEVLESPGVCRDGVDVVPGWT